MSQSFPVKTANVKAFKGLGMAQDYFEELMRQYRQGEAPCMFLPSLLSLSQSLDCSTLDIQCALMGLRKQGYDYFMMDIYGPITLWYPPKVGLIPESSPT
jgi:hypothetical protein